MNAQPVALSLSIIAATLTIGCASRALSQEPPRPTLKDTFKGHFLIGATIHPRQFQEEGQPTIKLVAEQFNAISTGNALKWGPFNPKPGEYNYGADLCVDFAKKNGMYFLGHVLFWHNQTPGWVFRDDNGKTLSRDALLERMRQRVRHVAKRYGTKIDAWDVVNESIMGNGKLRDSPWTRIIGDDFIEQAFRIADEELPKQIKLIYNDYSMTGKKKRDAVVKMVRDLKARGVRIDGVGMQGHWSINGPSIDSIEQSIIAFHNAGVEVHITELDIDVLPRKGGMWGNADVRRKMESDPAMNPYTDGLPDDMQQKLAKRYAEIFRLFLKHDRKIRRVTFWGTTDKHSWLNNWPIKGRTNHPLLFDRQGKPKPAFDAVVGLRKAAATKTLDIYLLIGQSNMAGRAKISDEGAKVIDGCYLLDDQGKWIPAKNPLNLYSTIRKNVKMQRLGPGYAFAKAMRKADPNTPLGLVVNAKGGSSIEQWAKGTRFYNDAIKRTQQAIEAGGTLKGICWHQGESNSSRPDGYLDQLKTLIGNLRTDLGTDSLPFVAGQIMNTPAINKQIAALPDAMAHTGYASAKGLTATDRWHFDTASANRLGERYAKAMLMIQAKQEKKAETKP